MWMRVKSKITDYYEVRAKKISRVLKTPSLELLPEDIYSLRVNIKKLRALISLCSFEQDSPAYGSLKALKRLFSRAGELREAQLQWNTIETQIHSTPLPMYSKFLIVKLMRAKASFALELKLSKKTLKSGLATLKNELELVSKRDVLIFEKRNRLLQNALLKQKVIDSEELHTLRKHLKKRLYLNDVLGDLIVLDAPEKKLSHLLGAWHDTEVIGLDIEKDLKVASLPSKEAKALKTLSKNYLFKAKKMQNLIMKNYCVVTKD